MTVVMKITDSTLYIRRLTTKMKGRESRAL